MQTATVMNPSRLRILEFFITHGTATVSEIHRELSDIPQASLYRHIKVLFDDGWIVLDSEVQKRGATEKRYRPTNVRLNMPDTAPVFDILTSLHASFSAYFAEGDADPVRDMLYLSTSSPMLSDEEFASYITEQGELLKKYLGKTPDGIRKPRRLTFISSPCEKED